jgi:hypothetical protein
MTYNYILDHQILQSAGRNASSALPSLEERYSLRGEPRRRPRAAARGGGSVHGRERYYCAQCGGAGMCEHGRKRRFCKEGCGGQALCVHLMNKYSCKACKAPAPGAAASGEGGSGAALRKRKREEEEEEEEEGEE